MSREKTSKTSVSRRQFLLAGGAAAAASGLPGIVRAYRGIVDVRFEAYRELVEQECRLVHARAEGDGARRTYVYRLKHANAGELAQTLSQVYGLRLLQSAERPRVAALSDRSLSSTLEGFRQRDLERGVTGLEPVPFFVEFGYRGGNNG